MVVSNREMSGEERGKRERRKRERGGRGGECRRERPTWLLQDLLLLFVSSRRHSGRRERAIREAYGRRARSFSTLTSALSFPSFLPPLSLTRVRDRYCLSRLSGLLFLRPRPFRGIVTVAPVFLDRDESSSDCPRARGHALSRKWHSQCRPARVESGGGETWGVRSSSVG